MTLFQMVLVSGVLRRCGLLEKDEEAVKRLIRCRCAES